GVELLLALLDAVGREVGRRRGRGGSDRSLRGNRGGSLSGNLGLGLRGPWREARDGRGQHYDRKRNPQMMRKTATGGVETRIGLRISLRRTQDRTQVSAFVVGAGVVLRAVVRMARQDGRGPINLFQKHDANHLMRP